VSVLSRPLYPPVWLILHLLAQGALHRVLPLARVIPAPWFNLGLLPGFAGVLLILWSLALFVRRGTPAKPFTESTALLLEGPYRVTRNPIYLGLTLILVSVAMFLGTLSPWLPVISFVLIVRRQFVLREEALLRARFGAEYEAYCSRVRRWL
jgi:protein-S-isoprenylcysteine O-methyltransferase Ste14